MENVQSVLRYKVKLLLRGLKQNASSELNHGIITDTESSTSSAICLLVCDESSNTALPRHVTSCPPRPFRVPITVVLPQSADLRNYTPSASAGICPAGDQRRYDRWSRSPNLS
ncbi:hypothetical protein J6590_003176 [Homalodisca vitripennis]|nr:hypothetical protein J6590_003176 [Homalodisca vitripennis]